MKASSIAILIIVAGWGSCLAQDPGKLEGMSIPVPPGQGRPWTAPASKLPPALIDACKDLFDLGFSDPRGCEYRAMVVEVNHQVYSNSDEPATSFKTHGWVLPAGADKSRNARRFGVGWNGLVYPLLSVGAPADLDADMAKLFAQDEVGTAPQGPGKFILDRAWAEDEELSAIQFAPCKIALLLRLGKTDLAQKLWDLWGVRINSQRDPWTGPKRPELEPFALLSRDWLWSNFNRAVQAHLRGEPGAALAFVQVIPGLRTKVEQAAVRRGFSLKVAGSKEKTPAPVLDLTFLDQVPAILADEQRRVKEHVTNKDEEMRPDAITDKTKRIALLVRDLEDVVATPFMSPGYTEFSMSPVVQALVKQGEDAVDPLLECLEHDERLTRSLDQGGAMASHSFSGARIIGVEEPAFAALQAILHAGDQFPALDVPYVNYRPIGPYLGRVALAEKVRDYWKKYRNQTQAERWYGILLDDQATPGAWAEAAGNIVLPDNKKPFAGYGFMVLEPVNTPGKAATPVGLLGEALRGKTGPSVSELLIKRLKQTMADSDPKSPFPMEPPRKLARALARWDGKNQLETLRWYCGELQKIILTQSDTSGPVQIDDLVVAYLERIEAGDAQAPAGYAAWIRLPDTNKKLNILAHMYGATFFSPLWSYPDDPVMIETAKWLFQDPESPWSLGPADPDPTWTIRSAHLPLISLPVFRSLILQQLQDKTVGGHAEITGPHKVMLTYNHSYGSGIGEPDDLPVGTKMETRLCDAIAYSVSKIEGAPECNPWWTTERRDEAVRKTDQFLRRYGDRLAHKTTSSEELRFQTIPEQFLRFAPLDHPATKADVDAGLAIFSMEGKGERKIWPLPETPLHAKWTKLKDYPNLGFGANPATGKNEEFITGYDQQGTIWQAEDVLTGGKWKRYFGFMGRNCLAVVPADEIEFSDGQFEAIGGSGWGGWIDMGQTGSTLLTAGSIAQTPGEPVPVRVWIKNLKGAERAFPKTRPAGGPVNAKDLGIEVGLEYFPGDITALFSPGAKWQDVTAKGPLQITLQDTPAALGSSDKTLLLEFDLAKTYGVLPTGTYRVDIEFTSKTLLNYKGFISSRNIEVTK